MTNNFEGALFHCGHNESTPKLQIDENDISFVSTINALGIFIDNELNFSYHVT